MIHEITVIPYSQARIDIAEKRVSELLRDLNNARAQAADAQRAAARKSAEMERRIENLVDENSSLLLEIESRPSVKDLKAAQRQVREQSLLYASLFERWTSSI